MTTLEQLHYLYHEAPRENGVLEERTETAKWLGVNIFDIMTANRDRIYDTCKNMPRVEAVSQRTKEYCPDEVLDVITGPFYFRFKSPRPLLYTNIYAATRHEMASCHQLITGEQMSVSLFGKEKAFMKEIIQAGPAMRDSIYEMLNKNVDPITEPCYIVKERCRELAVYHGLWLKQLTSFSNGIQPAVRTKITEFVQTDVDPYPTYKESTNDALHKWSQMPYRLALTISVVYGVPMDYFFLQDYSHLAVLDTRPLSPYFQKILSAYLCAKPEARAEANATLIFRDTVCS